MRGATRAHRQRLQIHRISIHAPLAGCDVYFFSQTFDIDKFQSTHPLRGATRITGLLSRYIYNFNPRTPCGVRYRRGAAPRRRQDFNPRTPCGVRRLLADRLKSNPKFQSTHPLRGATSLYSLLDCSIDISIHAPLAGCDYDAFETRVKKGEFQSTHPLRGATSSIRAGLSGPGYFNPRTPCGVRQQSSAGWPTLRNFNPRTPCGVRLEFASARIASIFMISIHAPLAGCDPCHSG